MVAAITVGVCAGGIAAFYLVATVPAWPEGFSPRAFEELILSWGAWGVAASIGLMVLHSFLPFPGEFVAIANGLCYGAFWGSVITWVGAMLGAFLAFGITRRLGRPFAERAIRRKDWQRLDDWLARQGASAVFLARFVPVISFNLINYAAGLTRISWWTFAWATGLGILPITVLMVLLGDRMESLPWGAWIAVIAAGFALWFAGRRFFPGAEAPD